MADQELVRQLREAILGEPVYDVDELLAAAGTDRRLADELWLALGFPVAEPEDRQYNEIDADALRSVDGLIGLELVEETRLLAMTRVMGQSMARLAAAQLEMFGEELQALVEHDVEGMDDEVRAAITDMLVPGVERFVTYVWRRHLLAAFVRAVDEPRGTTVLGFVDLVDYTRSTRELADDELAEIVSRFERHVYESVTNSGARLRKLLGDGVMFEASDAATAATAALNLVQRCAADPHLGGARGGLAMGHTLEKEGDVYGATVNRASRLAGLARANTVLADGELGAVLHQHPGFDVRALEDRKVKGLGRVSVSVIRPGPA